MLSTSALRRFAVASIAAPALVLGAPAIASADTSFDSSSSSAGPKGAQSESVSSSVDRDGRVSFEERSSSAGPDGASTSSTSSSAGGSGTGSGTGSGVGSGGGLLGLGAGGLL